MPYRILFKENKYKDIETGIFETLHSLERVVLYRMSVFENAQVKLRNCMKVNKNGARSHNFFSVALA